MQISPIRGRRRPERAAQSPQARGDCAAQRRDDCRSVDGSEQLRASATAVANMLRGVCASRAGRDAAAAERGDVPECARLRTHEVRGALDGHHERQV
jgi:hypothetical protein